MTDTEVLKHFLLARRQPGADPAAIDTAIFERFGCMQAVMFTDLVGFSRLVEAFGIIHFLQLIEESESLFLPMIQQHQGRCLKREGDSLLAVFDKPEEALATARTMVKATVLLNVGRAPEHRIEVCIGLGFGQVLRVGAHEVWGAQVNAASKLGEEMARGGEILVTQEFRQAMATHEFSVHGTLHGAHTVFRDGPAA
jgi:adenylate cyclase